MEINSVSPRDYQVIQSYGDGGFRVSGRRFDGSVLVFPRHTVAWPVATAGELTPECLALLAEASSPVELLLLGTGQRMQPVPAEVRRYIKGCGIALDVMDTGAACRTYNVLLAEGRPVAAALMAVG